MWGTTDGGRHGRHGPATTAAATATAATTDGAATAADGTTATTTATAAAAAAAAAGTAYVAAAAIHGWWCTAAESYDGDTGGRGTWDAAPGGHESTVRGAAAAEADAGEEEGEKKERVLVYRLHSSWTRCR